MSFTKENNLLSKKEWIRLIKAIAIFSLFISLATALKYSNSQRDEIIKEKYIHVKVCTENRCVIQPFSVEKTEEITSVTWE